MAIHFDTETFEYDGEGDRHRAALTECVVHSHEWSAAEQDVASALMKDMVKVYWSRPGRLLRGASQWELQALLGLVLEIEGFDGSVIYPELRWCHFPNQVVCYRAWVGAPLKLKQFEDHREYIEQLWGGAVTMMVGGSVGAPIGSVVIRPAAAALSALPSSIPLLRRPGAIVLGSDVFTGEVVTTGIAQITHMLVMGTSGFGKSVFLHQLICQLEGHYDLEQMYLLDFKGGVEFLQYGNRSEKTRVVWRYEDAVSVVGELVDLMDRRLLAMRAEGRRSWIGPRVFFVVDEFAQIQLWPVTTREEKAIHDRLIANLNKLAMLGRAVGIVIIAAIQKATTDVMDSSFRANLQTQVCFRVANRLMAASMFGSTEDLKLDPIALPRGWCVYHDPTAGGTRYLQVHIAPEAGG